MPKCTSTCRPAPFPRTGRIEDAYLRYREDVARMQCHHVYARMRMTRQEHYLFRHPSLRNQAFDNSRFELRREREKVGSHKSELTLTLHEHQRFGPDGVVDAMRRLAHARPISAKARL